MRPFLIAFLAWSVAAEAAAPVRLPRAPAARLAFARQVASLAEAAGRSPDASGLLRLLREHEAGHGGEGAEARAAVLAAARGEAWPAELLGAVNSPSFARAASALRGVSDAYAAVPSAREQLLAAVPDEAAAAAAFDGGEGKGTEGSAVSGAEGGSVAGRLKPHRASETSLGRRLAEAGLEVFDAAGEPELAAFQGRAQALLDSLANPEDGPVRPRLVLIDDMASRASLLSLKDGEKVLAVTLGLIRSIRDDDELAFFLGHELDLPGSDLRKASEARRADGEEILPAILSRVARSEADARSALGRAIRAGYDPHAAYGALDRMGLASRRDTIALALAYWTRELGRETGGRFGDGERKRAALGAAGDRLRSGDFAAGRRRRIDALLAAPAARAVEAYRDALSPDAVPGGDRSPYSRDFEANWREVRRLGGSVDEEEKVDLQLRLHAALHRVYADARRAVLPDGFRAASLAQLQALLEVEERPVYFVHELIQYGRRRASEAARYARARRPFESDGGFEERLDAAFADRDEASVAAPRRDYELLSARGIRLRRGDAEVRAAAGLTRELVAAHRDMLLQPGQDARGFLRNAHLYLGTGLGTAALPAVLSAYAAAVRENLGKPDGDDWVRWDTMPALYAELVRADPARGAEALDELAAAAAPRLADLPRLAAFLENFSLRAPAEAGPWDQGEPAPTWSRGAADALEAALGRAFEAALDAAGSPAEVFRALVHYRKARLHLDADGAGPGARAAIDAALERASAALSRSTAGLDVRRARSAVLAAEPVLFAARLSDLPARRRMFDDLASLARVPRSRGRLPRFASYWELTRGLGSGMGREELFRRAAAVSVLLLPGGNRDQTLRRTSRNPLPASDGQEAGLLAWLDRRGSADLVLAGIAQATGGGPAPEAHRRFMVGRFRRILARHRRAGREESIARATHELWAAWDDAGLWETSNRKESFTELLPPADPAGRLEFFNATVEGLSRLLSERPHLAERMSWDKYADLEGVRRLLSDPAALEGLPPRLLAATFRSLARLGSGAAMAPDDAFRAAFKAADSDAETARILEDESLVKALHFDSSKTLLARWQIERMLRDVFPDVLKARPATRPGPPSAEEAEERRDAAAAAHRMLADQFGTRSAALEATLSHVQELLLTDKLETEGMDEGLRVNSGNWAESSGLAAAEAPAMMAGRMEDNAERWALASYLIGQRSEPPAELARYDDPEAWLTVRQARRHFLDAGVEARVYALQALLDENEGLLSDEGTRAELHRLVLGRWASQPVVSTVFQAYLETLPPGEAKVILARVLAGMAGQRGGSTSLKAALEAMGPFGIKAGQFLRTSGLLPEAERRQLDSFFDDALRPTRGQMFRTLTRIFGDALAGVEHVGEILGSGSLNYVAVAWLRHPGTGRLVKAAVRVQREAVEGRIRNENAVWERAAALLAAHPDAAVRRAALLLDEARAHAQETLAPGGSQLDLGVERAAYEAARGAYEDAADASGLRVEVARPLSDLQALVPEEHAAAISIYEYVPGVAHRDLPPSRRRAAALRVLKAELKALFAKGVFDPDGHVGNWLHDEAGDRLVRIDYAELQEIPAAERAALAGVLGALLKARPDAAMRRALVRALPGVVEFRGAAAPAEAELDAALRETLAEPGWPGPLAPQERLVALLERLERALDRSRPGTVVALRRPARSALASLAKLSYYRETLGSLAYGSALLDALGVSPIAAGLDLLLSSLAPSAR